VNPSEGVRILGIDGIPEVTANDDLIELISSAIVRQGVDLVAGDVVVVTHKVISKSEGRIVDLSTIEPSALALRFSALTGKEARQIEVVLRETRRVVRMAAVGVLISETEHGFVCANAGVDASNVPGDAMVCLLPADPDASAERLRAALSVRFGVEIAVIVTDSWGRPWRNGITNVAIGVAGMDPFADYRGESDPFGYPLVASRMAIADELASAAELVMGKLDYRPVAIIRGYEYRPPHVGGSTGRDLLMEPERDLFR
jgi:coenzyme F420-0:L-glutamate ligase/coenzyme F420-1:gamma-L-glutamate ligase